MDGSYPKKTAETEPRGLQLHGGGDVLVVCVIERQLCKVLQLGGGPFKTQ